ncbi:MAG: ketopantoate reductase family protein [Erysipelotrichaceae bacterium]|nr:ketopantoate reductase family protein [Erysipelotrichaceae bacterium]
MKEIKTVGMIGRGAIGVIFGRIIQQTLNDAMVFIVDAQRLTKYQQYPLYSNGQLCNFRYCTNVKDFQTVDLMIYATKFPALNNAIEISKPFINDDTIIISTLNGISSEDILRDTFKNNNVIRCIAQKMDSVYQNNEVNYSSTGELVVGIDNEHQKESFDTLIHFFDKVHIPYVISDDIVHDQWSKLMLNCGVNQVCAAYNIPYGGIQDNQIMKNKMIETMKEVQTVAQCMNIILTDEEINQWVKAIDALGHDAMPSMRQDVLAHRKTELELFSGTIIPLAKKYHIEVPQNKYLYEIIQHIESQY